MATNVPAIPLGTGTKENTIFAIITKIIIPIMSSNIYHLLSPIKA